MTAPWRDTTALPPVEPWEGYVGPDPMELAAEAALAERAADLGIDLNRTVWW